MNFHKKMKGKEGSVRHTGQTYPSREYGKERLGGGVRLVYGRRMLKPCLLISSRGPSISGNHQL